MKYFKVFSLVLVVLLSSLSVVFADDYDTIHSYTITIVPLEDGRLRITEEIDITAAVDYPNQPMTIGVPNRHFQITEWGPEDWVTSAVPKTSGGSWVALDFVSVPKAGQRFNFHFTVVQDKMAFRKEGLVHFGFTPAWFDFAKIESLIIKWKLPAGVSGGSNVTPQASLEGGFLVWSVSNLGAGERYPIEIAFPESAFPSIPKNAEHPATPVPSNPTTEAGTAAGGLTCSGLCITVLIVLGFVFLVWLFVRWSVNSSGTTTTTTWGNAYDGHDRDWVSDDGDGWGSCVCVSTCVTSSSPSSPKRRKRSGGGGSHSGRGSSCACVTSSPPSCACAGSGR